MTDTRIDTVRVASTAAPKAADTANRTDKTEGQDGQGFAALLAALDDFAATGLPQIIASQGDGEDAATVAKDQAEPDKPGAALLSEQELLPTDGAQQLVVGQHWGAVRRSDQDPLLTPTDGAQPLLSQRLGATPLSDQDQLLISQLQTPWMSLVGQTARLDAQGDTDLRQGVASDFLSGRGSATLLAHRQALEAGSAPGAGAHAALVDKNTQSNLLQTQAGQAQAAINSENAAQTQDLDKKQLAADAQQSAMQQLLKDEPPAPKALQLHAQPAPTAQAASGISLQGMSAVQPQMMEGLKDLLRAARSPQAEGVAEKIGAGQASHELLAAAAAIGGAAGAGAMHSGGQDASSFAQTQAGQDAAPTEREQEVSEQVAFWVHQKTQNAALSIQHEGRPIQVQVQLNGQEAHIRFAADDAQARQLLADGQAQLRELLQAQGLNLAGVSVDAGAADSQRGQNAEGRESARMARVSAGDAKTDGASTGVGRTAKSGVDLFV